jgi:DNA (cytosine-5)-methyltransferase 1
MTVIARDKIIKECNHSGHAGGTKPRIADLFCGAGGAGMGLHRAGFEVVGYDIEPQPNYPFEFHQADALGVDLGGFDAVWASPPCQRFVAGFVSRREEYPNLIPATRKLLSESTLPYIIENVRGAPIRADYRICGCQVGLPRIRRVRHFEASWIVDLELNHPCHHPEQVITVTGTGTPSGTWKALGRCVTAQEFKDVMGIDWMTRRELSQAIPPAYSQYIGDRLMAVCPR